MKIREERFEKVVERLDEFTTSEDVFFGVITGLILWATCLIWFPFWWFCYKIPQVVRDSRKVYWRKIKNGN